MSIFYHTTSNHRFFTNHKPYLLVLKSELWNTGLCYSTIQFTICHIDAIQCGIMPNSSLSQDTRATQSQKPNGPTKCCNCSVLGFNSELHWIPGILFTICISSRTKTDREYLLMNSTAKNFFQPASFILSSTLYSGFSPKAAHFSQQEDLHKSFLGLMVGKYMWN